MRSPLALLSMDDPNGSGERVWKVCQTEQSARGCSAGSLVFVRAPSPEERRSLEACLVPGGRVYHLSTLLGSHCGALPLHLVTRTET
jgi:hypothetical protein